MTFTVEIQNPEETVNSNHIVHLYLDRGEIDQLILDLQALRKAEAYKSVRLFTSDWGGGELSRVPQRPDTVISNMLRIWVVD